MIRLYCKTVATVYACISSLFNRHTNTSGHTACFVIYFVRSIHTILFFWTERIEEKKWAQVCIIFNFILIIILFIRDCLFVSLILFALFYLSENVVQPAKLRNKSDVRNWVDLTMKLKEESNTKSKQINELSEQMREKEEKITELERELADLRQEITSLRLSKAEAIPSTASAPSAEVNEDEIVDVEEVGEGEPEEPDDINPEFFTETNNGFVCAYCEAFTSTEKFKVRAHIKNNCKGVPRVSDHKCPICDGCFTYEGLRMHLTPFIGRNADENIRKATTNHHNKSKREHQQFRDSLVAAKKRAKIENKKYKSIFPVA